MVNTRDVAGIAGEEDDLVSHLFGSYLLVVICSLCRAGKLQLSWTPHTETPKLLFNENVTNINFEREW